MSTPNLLASDAELRELTPTARADRLERLLEGVLEVQFLLTEPNFQVDHFMQRIVDMAESLTGAKGAVVELVEGDEMLYRCASPSIGEHVGLRLQRSNSLSGLCVQQQRALRCDDTETDSRVDREACQRVGVRSMICVPLFQAGQAIGVLKVMSPEPGTFDASHQHVLGVLAGTLGAALGNQLALEALKTSEETFRSAMETSSIGMALVKPNGRFLKVNAALCELLGYSDAELLANDVQSITHPDDRDRDRQLLLQALTGQLHCYRVDKRYYHHSGRTIWVQLSVALVRDSTGIPRYFVGHIQDLSEQREVDRLKTEFISMVSHELRTPLTSIRGSLGLVLGAMADGLPQKTRTLLDVAHNNAERLAGLINDILDIDKIASGNMRFDMREVSLASITAKAVALNEGYAQRFKASVMLTKIDEQLRICVDEDRYIQVLSNLLSNAAKFSPSGATITVSCEVLGGYARVSVWDEGPGISEEFRARIFGRFSQADSSEGRRVGGTGLGLHISREMVERMQGRIGFDTTTGRGTAFWVEFPRLASP